MIHICIYVDMGIEKRIQLIMVSNRLTAASFADKIGVQRSNVSHVLNGRNKPGYEFIVKIIHAFPNVSSHWLLTGEGVEAQVQSEVQFPESKSVESSVQAEIKLDTNVTNAGVGKVVTKVMVFYDDFTFDSYVPSL